MDQGFGRISGSRVRGPAGKNQERPLGAAPSCLEAAFSGLLESATGHSLILTYLMARPAAILATKLCQTFVNTMGFWSALTPMLFLVYHMAICFSGGGSAAPAGGAGLDLAGGQADGQVGDEASPPSRPSGGWS